MRSTKIYTVTLTAVMTGLVCVVAPFSIPLPGDVPLSMANFMLLLTVCLLGGRCGSVCCLIYLLLGTAGVPVFAGFGAGIGRLVGPTGGYLVGYLPMVLVAGAFYRIGKQRKWMLAMGLALGILASYVPGTLWLSYVTGTDLLTTCVVGVLPFLPGDMVKVLLLTIIMPRLRRAIAEAGYLPTE